MTESDQTDIEENLRMVFDVELFIVHPTFDPAEISAGLGLDANFSHRIGDQRKTPKGTLLPGLHRDTRWRHCRRYETSDQWFAGEVAELIDCLEPRRAFLRNLRATGGTACVLVQFLGDGNFGDEIPRDILVRLIDLELDLGIECFTYPQSPQYAAVKSPNAFPFRAMSPSEDRVKNIQVIDGALNCTFSLFQATEEEFALLFPEPRQDIQYAEDLALLPNQERVGAALTRIWERPVRKQYALGIHGTLFYQLERYKAWYREKREDAVESSAVNRAQRRLFRIE